MSEPENKSSEPVSGTAAQKEMPSETSLPNKKSESEAQTGNAGMGYAQDTRPFVVKQTGSNALAICALVLAALGLGAGGFLFVQGQNVLKNQ